MEDTPKCICPRPTPNSWPPPCHVKTRVVKGKLWIKDLTGKDVWYNVHERARWNDIYHDLARKSAAAGRRTSPYDHLFACTETLDDEEREEDEEYRKAKRLNTEMHNSAITLSEQMRSEREKGTRFLKPRYDNWE